MTPSSSPADGPRCGDAPAGAAPRVAFRELRALWIQLTGTLCNLACRHCFNASGPKDPWLAPLDADGVRRRLAEADELGASEIYFTGGEPFLHPDLFAVLEAALAIAPTTILTNGTLIDDTIADALAARAAASPYSLEIRISLDGATAAENDRLRGRGSFDQALAAAGRLARRQLYPIMTATEIVVSNGGASLYERLRSTLLAAGIERPRIKILPVLPLGRWRAGGPGPLLTAPEIETIDPARLQCTETRVVAAGGIYACPILAGLPGARLAVEHVADALGPASLYHPVCRTCYETGLACRNF